MISIYIYLYIYILDQYRHFCFICVYLHLNGIIRAYVIIILIFLELNNLKMPQILAFHSSFLNYLNTVLIDSEIIISVKPWRFFRDIYIHVAWILKLLQNVSFIVIYHLFILYSKYVHGIVGCWTYLMQKQMLHLKEN